MGNGARNGGHGTNNKDYGTRDQAVVLTLRKRQPSTGRRSRRTSQRRSDWDAGTPGAAGAPSAAALATSVDPSTVIDPWQDPSTASTSRRRQATEQPRRSRTLVHRLSYDPASGVIVLPDEAAWLDSDDSDEVVTGSDGEDYGTELDRSVASVGDDGDGEVGVGVGSLLAGTSEGSAVATQVQGRGSVVSTPTRTSRYGTYFHHPEKRKQTIPGEFPFR